MKILIYGTGCARCEKLHKNVLEVINKNNLNIEVEKITDIQAIMQAQVLQTPALSIDGKMIETGKVFSIAELTKLLTGNSTEKNSEKGYFYKNNNKNFVFKKILTLLILLLVCIGTAMVIMRELNPSEKISIPASQNSLMIYYFHGNKRCYTCNKIEEQTKDVLAHQFSTLLEKGKIIFKSINIDEKVNEHFIKKFDLSNGTVVLKLKNNYKKLDNVWKLINDKVSFDQYIIEHVQVFVEDIK